MKFVRGVPNNQLYKQLPDEIEEITDAAWKLCKSIQKTLCSSSTAQAHSSLKLAAFQSLLLNLIFQVYADVQGEAFQTLEELLQVYERLFSVSGGSSSNSDEDEGDLEPNDVLVDILVGLLSKPSSLMRHVALDVFKHFCDGMTVKGLDVIFQVLETRAAVGDTGDLFNVEQEGDEEEDDDDDKGEKDSDEDQVSSSDSEDDDGAQEVLNAQEREKLMAAIQQAHGDAISDVDSDEGLDDDQMDVFDDKLVEIFKERKRLKTEKKGMY